MFIISPVPVLVPDLSLIGLDVNNRLRQPVSMFHSIQPAGENWGWSDRVNVSVVLGNSMVASVSVSGVQLRLASLLLRDAYLDERKRFSRSYWYVVFTPTDFYHFSPYSTALYDFFDLFSNQFASFVWRFCDLSQTVHNLIKVLALVVHPIVCHLKRLPTRKSSSKWNHHRVGTAWSDCCASAVRS